MKTKPLTFEEFQRVNLERCKDGFGGLNNYSLLYLSNALAGEVGEVCNIVKKMERERVLVGRITPSAEVKYVKAITNEVADVITYGDLLLSKLMMETEHVLVRKFNEVSTRVGSNVKLVLNLQGGRQW